MYCSVSSVVFYVTVSHLRPGAYYYRRVAQLLLVELAPFLPKILTIFCWGGGGVGPVQQVLSLFDLKNNNNTTPGQERILIRTKCNLLLLQLCSILCELSHLRPGFQISSRSESFSFVCCCVVVIIMF